MPTIEHVESVIRCATERAILDGIFMIAGDWGICWDASVQQWVFDLLFVPQRGTCALGACLLMCQTPPPLRNGLVDEHGAVAKLLDVDTFWVCSFVNGWEDEAQANWRPEPYALGQKFAWAFLPWEVLKTRARVTQLPRRIERSSLVGVPAEVCPSLEVHDSSLGRG